MNRYSTEEKQQAIDLYFKNGKRSIVGIPTSNSRS